MDELETKKKKKKLPIWFYILFGVLIAVFLFSAWKVADYLIEMKSSKSVTDELAAAAVTVRTTPAPKPVKKPTASAEPTATPEPGPTEIAPIFVDFDRLWETCPDTVGWIYSEGTVISYPIVQADDNEYYVERLPDGTSMSTGSVFLDYRNASDFSDSYSILYGHDMMIGTIFGTLDEYKNDPDYYTEHPVMYLLTPDADYKLVLTAGAVISAYDRSYSCSLNAADRAEFIEECMQSSTFDSGEAITEQDKMLILSTCTYDFPEARYVILCRIEPLARPDSTDGLTEETDSGDYRWWF